MSLPCLTLIENVNDITVTCDGYKLMFPTVDWDGNFFEIQELSDVIVCRGHVNWDNGTLYSIQYDSNRSIKILENGASRVVLGFKGVYSTGAHVELANLTNETIVYIYPDRFVLDFTLVATGTITATSGSNHPLIQEQTSDTWQSIYEASGVEGSGDEYVSKTGTYIGGTTDTNLNFMTVLLRESGYSMTQYCGNLGDLRYRQLTNLTSGTYEHTVLCIVDSPAREGLVKLYDIPEYRLNLGTQYKDHIIS